MNKSDPTEDVLATIARIFEHADAMKSRPPLEAIPPSEPQPIVNPFAPQEPAHEPVREPVAEITPVLAEEMPVETPQIHPHSASDSIAPESDTPALPPESSSRSEDAEPISDGYTRVGPGPLDAIRFRWTARAHAEDSYFVDETIGPKSRAITSGPMSGEDAIAFINLQVQEAHERYERLKQTAAEMPTHRRAQGLVEQVHAEHDASEDQGF